MRAILIPLLFVSTLCSAGTKPIAGYVPPNGFVPDAETAIAIAVAVWKPIYGSKEIEAQRPFRAKLIQGIWHVAGAPLPPEYRGGVAEAQISKEDGRVLHVIHGK